MKRLSDLLIVLLAVAIVALTIITTLISLAGGAACEGRYAVRPLPLYLAQSSHCLDV